MQTKAHAIDHTFFPAILFLLAAVAVPMVFIAIAHVGTEGELLMGQVLSVR